MISAEIRLNSYENRYSSNAIGILPIKLVAPLTEWKDYFASNIWHVKVMPDSTNGLAKPSAIDTLQLRGLDTGRFVRKLGNASPTILKSIVVAVAAVIEY